MMLRAALITWCHSGYGRWRALSGDRGLGVVAREQILDADLRVDHGSPQEPVAAIGPGELPGPFPVAPACPRRAGPGEPDRADDNERRHEQPEEPGPDLPLQQRDR